MGACKGLRLSLRLSAPPSVPLGAAELAVRPNIFAR